MLTIEDGIPFLPVAQGRRVNSKNLCAVPLAPTLLPAPSHEALPNGGDRRWIRVIAKEAMDGWKERHGRCSLTLFPVAKSCRIDFEELTRLGLSES